MDLNCVIQAKVGFAERWDILRPRSGHVDCVFTRRKSWEYVAFGVGNIYSNVDGPSMAPMATLSSESVKYQVVAYITDWCLLF